MLVYAHRGSSGTDPENTLRAFRQAVVDGADGVELDVHLSRDGVPVVIHDRDVSRTTDGTGFVDELDAAALARLDAGEGERVPTLDDVVGLLAGTLRLYVEIKQAAAVPAALDVLARYHWAQWLIGSFDLGTLRGARAISATAELWPIADELTDELIDAAQAIGASAVSLGASAATAEAARRCADAGLGMAVWTVNDVAGALRVRDLGAVGICTDVPATIVDALA